MEQKLLPWAFSKPSLVSLLVSGDSYVAISSSLFTMKDTPSSRTSLDILNGTQRKHLVTSGPFHVFESISIMLDLDDDQY